MQLLTAWPFSSILGAIEAFFYLLLVQWPLELVDKFNIVVKYLSGQEIMNLVMTNDNSNLFGVSNLFLLFVFSGIILMILLIFSNVLSAWFGSPEQGNSKLIRTFTGIIKALIFIISIPIFYIILNTLAGGITTMVFNTVGENTSISDIIFRMGYHPNLIHNQDWINSQHYWNLPDFPDGSYSILLPAFGSLFTLVVFALLGISLVSRIIELLVLFTISPWPAIASLKDGGQKMLIWRDFVLAKFCSSIISVVAFVIFIGIMPKVSLLDVGDWTASSIIKVFFITAGSVATIKAQVMLSALIGQQTGISEGFQTLIGMKATFGASKMAAGGIKGFLFGKKGKGGGSVAGKAAGTALLGAGVAGAAIKGVGKTYNAMASISGHSASNIANIKNHGLDTVGKKHLNSMANFSKEKIKFGIDKSTSAFKNSFNKSKIN